MATAVCGAAAGSSSGVVTGVVWCGVVWCGVATTVSRAVSPQ